MIISRQRYEMRNVLIVADLGAAGNLLRNLLLLNEHFDWPLSAHRIDTIKNQYLPVSLDRWLPVEYKLRFWEACYEIDLSDHLDWAKFSSINPSKKSPIIFLNHSAFWQIDEFDMFLDNFDILHVSPITKFGLEWQIRSYSEKKTVSLLHDFCFEHNREKQKADFIKRHGPESYYKMNITNMYNIIRQRQIDFRSRLDDKNCFPLENFLQGPATPFIEFIESNLGIKLDIEITNQVMHSWRSLHWPLEHTEDWNYHGCIA